MFRQESIVENVHRHLSRTGTPERSVGRSIASSAVSLRIGQLTRRKELEDLELGVRPSSATSEEESLTDLIGQNPPWYLRGPQTKYIDFVHYDPHLDDSSMSEGGLSEDSEEDSDESGSSSSEEEEPSRKALPEKKPDDEDESDDDLTDRSQSKSGDQIVTGSKKKLQFSDATNSDSASSSSTSMARKSSVFRAMSNRSKSIALALGEDSTHINLNPKLVMSYEEKIKAAQEYNKKHGKNKVEDTAYDVSKLKEVSDLLLNQKIALFEQEQEQMAKNEAAIRDETMKGAGYWKVRKVLKFLKMADAEGTHQALLILLECGLDDPQNRSAIDDTGAFEIFVNLMGVDCSHCRISTLRVMDQLMEASDQMGELAMNLGLAEEIRTNLMTEDDEEVLMAVKCLMNLSGIKRARSVLRKSGLMPILFQLIHRVPMSTFKLKLCDYLDEAHRRYEIALGALFILTFLLRSPQVRLDLFDIGFNTIMVPMLSSKEQLIIKAMIEGAVMCASQRKYRQRFEINHLIKHIVKHWKKHEELVLHFLYKMSIGPEARDQLIEFDVLSKLANFIQNDSNMTKDPYGFKYGLACLHRMGAHPEARNLFHAMNLIEPLIKILRTGPEAFKIWVVGILSQLTIFPENWKVLVQVGGLHAVLDLILSKIEDTWLVAYSLKILADVAHGPEARPVLESYPNTLHYLLALLSDDRPMITRCAAMALVPLTRIYTDYAEVMKADNDAIETLMDRLLHKDENVVSAVCEALAACITEQSLLPIVQDLGLKGVVHRLLKTENESLQENVSLLITMTVDDDETKAELGNLGVVERLAEYLESPNIHVVIAAGNALWSLTYDKDNCFRLVNYKPNVVQTLLEYTNSPFKEVSLASLGCLRNIRHMVNFYETIRVKEEIIQPEQPSGKFPYHFKPQVFFHDEIEL